MPRDTELRKIRVHAMVRNAPRALAISHVRKLIQRIAVKQTTIKKEKGT